MKNWSKNVIKTALLLVAIVTILSCNGTNGTNGTNGQSTLIRFVTPDPNCTSQGTLVLQGLLDL